MKITGFGGFWSKSAIEEDIELTSINTPNLHLTTKQFLPKNWGLTEQLLHKREGSKRKWQKRQTDRVMKGTHIPETVNYSGRDHTEGL